MFIFLRPALLGVLSLAAVSSLHAEVDPHSYAQPDKVRTSALALDLDVSFEQHQLSGSAELSLDWHDPAARELVLDTRDLTIEKIEAADAAGKWSPAKFTLDEPAAMLGSSLHIALCQQSGKVRIV